ncbi:SDR family NAD(P)-dependent oxidoreductase [Cupriavidus numazuensis]|uniref:7-alpha-hydroxysteroid dehydrogenase n=1 Tax=Cupriavidus numazuensis TaxID=221992 RepID=A0ABN7PYA1_9BURK|nr:SDR family NAD(P)-dependent oxidoreductase [Cupriavidus numazuensis]CAG2147411.1 7-alpha-hydroxysteroid dehydrogenase [Cupriavidus numazuensis]
MNDILNLDGKVTLVTGAGQGVGEQIARHFSDHGATVFVNDFHLDRAEVVAQSIRDGGGEAFAVQADVSDPQSVQRMIAKAGELAGPIDVLVNNAGNNGAAPSADIRKPFWEHGREVWNSAIEVNFYGVIHCASAVIPNMIERKGGRIITIISDAGRVGEPGMEVYSGAKAGAAGFMRGIARTLGRHHITANCVAISATATPFTEKALNADPERLKKMMERYVIRRPGRPDDVANMALFLASDASSWITGQTYAVNGGFSFGL